MRRAGVNLDRQGGRGYFQARDFLLGTAWCEVELAKNKTATCAHRAEGANNKTTAGTRSG
ncbi:MAG: hypothetical protein AAB654_00635 [Acidobacteriota bacterium]